MEHLGYARLDTDRRQRTGDPEVVLGTGKTAEQVVALLGALASAHPDRAVLVTRLSSDALAAVRTDLPEAVVDEVARTATLGPMPPARGRVCVVTAGTSDLPVAREAAVTAAVFGAGVQVISDVGVAGLHRLLAVRDDLAGADCLVVVAGMEGALPSVVGGLVGVPLVAVPTSVGYGASLGGMAALLAMLNSCAPGVAVVNIDNGFGAGVFAARVARNARTAPDDQPAAQPQAQPLTEPVGTPVGAAVAAEPVTAPTTTTTRIGWLDTASGVSGDMLLGALVDAGVPLQALQDAVDAVVPGQVVLRAEPVTRAGLRAVQVHVDTTEPPGQRSWAQVRGLLEHADGLDAATRTRALATFGALAEAEAQVHGIDPDDVHFHEVGALDAIADVVGVCAGLQHLGLDALTCSPVAVGGGTVATAYGRLPVPAPAVAALLTGVPTTGGAVDAELATPTGAALVSQAATGYGRQPAMSVDRVGTGAGSRDHTAAPNVVRLLLGSPSAAGAATTAGTGRPLLLQTNVDDLDPRLWPDVLGHLLEVGASDAWLTPILMKKGRPAHTLSILVRPALRERVERVVFEETTTIGLRVQEVDKVALDRGELVVLVDGHPVRVKIATRGGEVVNRQPEHADVVAAARASGRAVKDVLAEAAAAARVVDARD